MDPKKTHGAEGIGGKLQGRDVNIQLENNFTDAVRGTKRQIIFERNEICETCKGFEQTKILKTSLRRMRGNRS